MKRKKLVKLLGQLADAVPASDPPNVLERTFREMANAVKNKPKRRAEPESNGCYGGPGGLDPVAIAAEAYYKGKKKSKK